MQFFSSSDSVKSGNYLWAWQTFKLGQALMPFWEAYPEHLEGEVLLPLLREESSIG